MGDIPPSVPGYLKEPSVKNLLFALRLAFPLAGIAAEGEVCLTAAVQADPVSQNAVTNNTVFDCQAAGKKTIPQLYKAGWRVVLLMPQMVMDASAPVPHSRWTIVIEKI